jgi:hypothetical protein
MISNFTALGLEPQGHIAGTASPLYGSIATLLGIGTTIGQDYDGRPLPLANMMRAPASTRKTLTESALSTSVSVHTPNVISSRRSSKARAQAAQHKFAQIRLPASTRCSRQP